MAEPVSPVIRFLEPYEQQLGKNQPEYQALPCLRSGSPYYTVSSRWRLTPEERKLVVEGADIVISQYTFNNPFQPTLVGVICKQPETVEEAQALAEQLGVNDELDERLAKHLS